MNQHSSHGGNNDGGKSFPQQNEANTQFGNTIYRSRNLEVNMNSEKSTPWTPGGQTSKDFCVPMNTGTTHIFYKTRMCHKFLQGNCRKGEGCSFAHGPHDLHQPPPNWQELVKDKRGGNGGGILNDEKNITQRTQETDVINIQTVVDDGRNQPGPYQVVVGTLNNTHPHGLGAVKGNYWRTRICGNWETTGRCAFIDNCRFAHGQAELNSLVRRMEGDGNSHKDSYANSLATSNPIHDRTIEPLATGSGTLVHEHQGARQPRGFLKLANKKLNRIYGDWIDEEEEESS